MFHLMALGDEKVLEPPGESLNLVLPHPQCGVFLTGE